MQNKAKNKQNKSPKYLKYLIVLGNQLKNS